MYVLRMKPSGVFSRRGRLLRCLAFLRVAFLVQPEYGVEYYFPIRFHVHFQLQFRLGKVLEIHLYLDMRVAEERGQIRQCGGVASCHFRAVRSSRLFIKALFRVDGHFVLLQFRACVLALCQCAVAFGQVDGGGEFCFFSCFEGKIPLWPC